MELTETKQRFIELRAQGYSFEKIAKEMGKSKQALIDWSKELSEEIANIKAMELEALYEKHFLLKEHRIKDFACLLNSIKTELGSRDLSDISTDKLLDLFLKYQEALKTEITEPIFKSSGEMQEEQELDELLSRVTELRAAMPQKRLKAV